MSVCWYAAVLIAVIVGVPVCAGTTADKPETLVRQLDGLASQLDAVEVAIATVDFAKPSDREAAPPLSKVAAASHAVPNSTIVEKLRLCMQQEPDHQIWNSSLAKRVKVIAANEDATKAVDQVVDGPCGQTTRLWIGICRRLSCEYLFRLPSRAQKNNDKDLVYEPECVNAKHVSQFKVALRALLRSPAYSTPNHKKTLVLATGPEGAGTHILMDIGQGLNQNTSAAFMPLSEGDATDSQFFTRLLRRIHEHDAYEHSSLGYSDHDAYEAVYNESMRGLIMEEKKRCIANALMVDAQDIWRVEARLPLTNRSYPSNEISPKYPSPHCNILNLTEIAFRPEAPLRTSDPVGFANIRQVVKLVLSAFPDTHIFGFHAPVLQDDVIAPIFDEVISIAKDIPGLQVKILVMTRDPEDCFLSQHRRDFCRYYGQEGALGTWDPKFTKQGPKIASLAGLVHQGIWDFGYVEAQMHGLDAHDYLVVNYNKLTHQPDVEGLRIGTWLTNDAVAFKQAAMSTIRKSTKQHKKKVLPNADLQALVDSRRSDWIKLLNTTH